MGDTKTKLSKRVLTISQIALPYIQEAERRAGGRSDFVFGGREPLSYTQHRQMMHRISNQMNIKGITGYTFRHTVITDIYETTHDANIASAVAGHLSLIHICRIDAIYGRQSIDKKDSISIESQFEFCRYELKGGEGKMCIRDRGGAGRLPGGKGGHE